MSKLLERLLGAFKTVTKSEVNSHLILTGERHYGAPVYHIDWAGKWRNKYSPHHNYNKQLARRI